MLIKILEILRIAGVSIGMYISYSIGMATSTPPESVLHLISPWVLVSIAGTSAIEGIFFGKQSAAEKGFEQGSNYQKQSAFGLLSYAILSLVVYFGKLGTNAEITILLAFMTFMVLSSSNHAYEAIAKKNYKWANLNRPFLTLLLIVGMWYPVVNTLFK